MGIHQAVVGHFLLLISGSYTGSVAVWDRLYFAGDGISVGHQSGVGRK
jgi:hypothetical protein